jgi:hypothetical protein
MATSFKVATDFGTHPDASYLDAEFLDGPYAGLIVDAYCVDIGHSISPGRVYDAKAMSCYDTSIAELADHIDDPAYLPNVAWLLNEFKAGTTISADYTGGTVDYIAACNAIDSRTPLTAEEIQATLAAFGDGTPTVSPVISAGTLQRAVWNCVDHTPNYGAAGADPRLACFMAYRALEHSDFVPACGDIVPLVLATEGVAAQTTIAAATLAQVDVPCASGGEETAWASEAGSRDSPSGLANQFDGETGGSNWGTYVNFACVNC